jgi:hypothetical protein
LRDAREPPRDATKRRERLSDGDFLEEDLGWIKMRMKHRGKTETETESVRERQCRRLRCEEMLNDFEAIEGSLLCPALVPADTIEIAESDEEQS